MRIAFLNPQGNFDPEDRYLTEHPDFGGQLIYVKELGLAMARQGVQVDIFTRRIRDPLWPGFAENLDGYPDSGNLRIIRIPFGGDAFIPKEKLWPHIPEFAQGIQDFYKHEGDYPLCCTSHYGDGGLTGVLLQQKLGLPFSFTAHSLGAQKMDKLQIEEENLERMDERYRFTYRIAAERMSMMASQVNIVSTTQERYLQYGHQAYKGCVDVEDSGRFAVIPPGVNTRVFFPEYEGDEQRAMEEKILGFLKRDLREERLQLPGIVASSRLDRKKNHLGLLKAYAGHKGIQNRANLYIVLRGLANPWSEWESARGDEGTVLKELLDLIQEYRLEGQVAFLDLAGQRELAALYRMEAQKGGLFALTALYEPFGLAPLEAAACGLPVVVTEHGGPKESFQEGEENYGILVNTEEEEDIARGLALILEGETLREELKQKGLKRVIDRYTWDKTAQGYRQVLQEDRGPSKVPQTFQPLTTQELASLYLERDSDSR